MEYRLNKWEKDPEKIAVLQDAAEENLKILNKYVKIDEGNDTTEWHLKMS